MSVWKWIQDNPIAFIVTLCSALSAALGAFLVWRSSRNKIATLEDALEAQAHRRRVVIAEAKAEVVTDVVEDLEADRIEVQKTISESRRRVVELERQTKTDDLSDADIARLFFNSGM